MVIICLITIISLALVWGVILQLPKTRGWAFEKMVAAVLALLPKKNYIVMNNLFFRSGKRTCQIDHLVISIYGIFIIESKNYLGVISGDGINKMLKRRVLGMNYKTRNPIDQNNWHVKYLIEHFPIIREHAEALVPIVVFNFSSSLKIKKAPCPVCKIQSLIKTIKMHKKPIITTYTLTKIEKEIHSTVYNHTI